MKKKTPNIEVRHALLTLGAVALVVGLAASSWLPKLGSNRSVAAAVATVWQTYGTLTSNNVVSSGYWSLLSGEPASSATSFDTSYGYRITITSDTTRSDSLVMGSYLCTVTNSGAQVGVTDTRRLSCPVQTKTGNATVLIDYSNNSGTGYLFHLTYSPSGSYTFITTVIERQVTTAPTLTAPAATITAGTNQLTLSWSSVPYATNYLLFRTTSPGVTANSPQVGGYLLGTSYVDSGLANTSTYYYRVEPIAAYYPNCGQYAMGINGVGSALPVYAAAITTTACAGYNLNRNGGLADKNGASQFALCPANYFAVVLSRNQENSNLFTPISPFISGNLTFFNGPWQTGAPDPGFNPGDTMMTEGNMMSMMESEVSFAKTSGFWGETWTYTCRPNTPTTVVGPLSNEVSGTPTLQAPTIAVVQGTVAGQAVVSWVSISGATSYQLYRSTSAFTATTDAGVSLVATIGTSGILSYTDAGLASGTTYHYRLMAVNVSTNSALSNDASVAMPVATLPPPTLSAKADPVNPTTQIIISGMSVAGASGYDVQFAQFGSTPVPPFPVSGPSYTAKNLSPGTTYTFSARSKSSTATSAWSQAVSANTTISLKIVSGGQVVNLDATPDLSAAAPTLRVSKGGTVYSVPLVPLSDANASKVRVNTKSGVMAAKKI